MRNFEHACKKVSQSFLTSKRHSIASDCFTTTYTYEFPARFRTRIANAYEASDSRDFHRKESDSLGARTPLSST